MTYITEAFKHLRESEELEEAGFLNNLKNKVGQGLQNAGQKLQGQPQQQQQQQQPQQQQQQQNNNNKRDVNEYRVDFISTLPKYQLDDYIKSAPTETGIFLVDHGRYENDKFTKLVEYYDYSLIASTFHGEIDKNELQKDIDTINKILAKSIEQMQNGKFPTIILQKATSESQSEAPKVIYHIHPMPNLDYKTNETIVKNLDEIVKKQTKAREDQLNQMRAQNAEKNKHNEADFSGNNSRWSQNTNYDSQNYRPNSASDRNPYYATTSTGNTDFANYKANEASDRNPYYRVNR